MNKIILVTLGKKGTKGSKTLTVNVEDKTIKLAGEKGCTMAEHFFGSLSKGEARKLRKIIHAHGGASVAALPRQTPPTKFKDKVDKAGIARLLAA